MYICEIIVNRTIIQFQVFSGRCNSNWSAIIIIIIAPAQFHFHFEEKQRISVKSKLRKEHITYSLCQSVRSNKPEQRHLIEAFHSMCERFVIVCSSAYTLHTHKHVKHSLASKCCTVRCGSVHYYFYYYYYHYYRFSCTVRLQSLTYKIHFGSLLPAKSIESTQLDSTRIDSTRIDSTTYTRRNTLMQKPSFFFRRPIKCARSVFVVTVTIFVPYRNKRTIQSSIEAEEATIEV